MSKPVKYLQPEQYASWCKKVDDPDWVFHRYRDAKDKAMANAIRELRDTKEQVTQLEAALAEAKRRIKQLEDKIRDLCATKRD